MKKSIFLCLLLSIAVSSAAQTTRMTVRKAELDTLRYVEPEFKSGLIIFNDNTTSSGALNIEIISQKVFFIDKDGYKLELSNDNAVRTVVIGKNTYYKKASEYVQLVSIADNNVGLGKVTSISVLEEEKVGAFGSKSETASITMVGTVSLEGKLYDFNEDQQVGILYKIIPYLCLDGKFITASKKSFLKAFPDKKQEIERYIEDNRVKFNSYDDVANLYKALTGK